MFVMTSMVPAPSLKPTNPQVSTLQLRRSLLAFVDLVVVGILRVRSQLDLGRLVPVHLPNSSLHESFHPETGTNGEIWGETAEIAQCLPFHGTAMSPTSWDKRVGVGWQFRETRVLTHG